MDDTIKNLKIDKNWTLFLDRDGVINKRLVNDYVKTTAEFEFLPGVPEAIANFSRIFGKIFIVTNQRGIARGLMSEDDLHKVHELMLSGIEQAGGKIDGIYYCPHDRGANCGCRKPDIGMAIKARADFSEIDFEKSIMAGDSASDMEFAKNAGMLAVRITETYSLRELSRALNLKKDR